MTRQTTIAIGILIAVVLSIPLYFGQDIHVEYDWDIDKTLVSSMDLFQSDYSGGCTGREMSDIDGSLVNHCQADEAQPEAVAMPVDLGYCWVYGCDGIITYYDYNSVQAS